MIQKQNDINDFTKLFGLISTNASANKLFVEINKTLKEQGINVMMIPLNIKEEDFAFTMSNMKNSQVNGAFIAKEYQNEILRFLENGDELQHCNFLLRREGKLYGEYLGYEGMESENNDELVNEWLCKNFIEKVK